MDETEYSEEERFDVLKSVIASRLWSFLYLAGITQTEFAEKAGVSRSDIWRIINKKANLKLSTITKIEVAMNNTELFLAPIKLKKEASDG